MSAYFSHLNFWIWVWILSKHTQQLKYLNNTPWWAEHQFICSLAIYFDPQQSGMTGINQGCKCDWKAKILVWEGPVSKSVGWAWKFKQGIGWWLGIDNVYLDYCKAFDSVPLKRLIKS